MSGITRIPQTIPAFDSYINVTDKYQLAVDPLTLQPNYDRLGLSSDESEAWTAKRTYWRDTLTRPAAMRTPAPVW